MTASRVQLGLKVTDLDASIAWYSAMFQTEPTKVRPGYANFAIADPPLKLVLFEGEQGGVIDHLGVEVASTDSVAEARQRVTAAGIDAGELGNETCCYANQDKFWANDPDGAPWEVYTVLGDTEVERLGETVDREPPALVGAGGVPVVMDDPDRAAMPVTSCGPGCC